MTEHSLSEKLPNLRAALDPKDLKRTLVSEGFEIFRTLKDRVQLADRVRENLIMDSGVAAGLGHEVFVVLRAQHRDFPHATEAEMFEQARALATAALALGYSEQAANIQVVHDPGDPAQVLETWFEITLSKAVASEPELLRELRFLLGLKKTTGSEDS